MAKELNLVMEPSLNVDIELNRLELKHEDDIVKAKPSMPVTAKIIYEKESYLNWILNQLYFTK